MSFFFVVKLGLSQKIVGHIRGVLVLGRGYLGPQETFAPPNFKVPTSRAPVDICYGYRYKGTFTKYV